jgi:hypothetical protein
MFTLNGQLTGDLTGTLSVNGRGRVSINGKRLKDPVQRREFQAIVARIQAIVTQQSYEQSIRGPRTTPPPSKDLKTHTPTRKIVPTRKK